MALNKGLAFEHAVMYAAMSRIQVRDAAQEQALAEAASKWSEIPQEIKDKATEIVLDLAPRLNAERQKFFKSFKKMSGGDETKNRYSF